MTPLARLGVAVVIAAAAFGAYRWWNGPERQITVTLEAIAARLSHDGPVNGLAAAAAAASIQEYLSPDVAIALGRPFAPLTGRDIVVAMAARVLAATPVLRVELVDVEIAMSDDRETANVTCGVTATFTDRAGQQTVDARELKVTLRARQGRWVVERAESVNVMEPVT